MRVTRPGKPRTPIGMLPYSFEHLNLLTPPALWQEFEELCLERSDVRITRYILRTSEQALEWLHSVGVCTHERLGTHVPPLPPKNLRQIVAAVDAEEFLWTGLVDLATLLSLYERHAAGIPASQAQVLDFGCGCGRMLRFLTGAQSTARAVGSDVNDALIAWCRKSLPGVEVRVNGPSPPLPFADATFDLIYSLSIFTHLNRESGAEWLLELGRVLRPGGLAIMTTSGIRSLEIIRNSAAHQTMFELSAAETDEIAKSFADVSFVYRRYKDAILQAANAGTDYGNTFIHPTYVQRHWNNEQFEVLEHLPAGLRGWQDIVILRRR
jgi:ubiquinone/menaquinone biosynthesis C-methylase UbiE